MNPLQKIWDAISYFSLYPAKVALILLLPACVLAASVANPKGAVNTFMIKLIDIIFEFWPSTPDDKKIGYMLGEFALEYPGIGWGPLYEIMHGVAILFGLILFFKLYKALPFT